MSEIKSFNIGIITLLVYLAVMVFPFAYSLTVYLSESITLDWLILIPSFLIAMLVSNDAMEYLKTFSKSLKKFSIEKGQ